MANKTNDIMPQSADSPFNSGDEAKAAFSFKKMAAELSRRIARHGIVLAFTAGIMILFVIEGALPFWLALTGMTLIAASALIYTGPMPAINPRRWRTERRYAMRRDAANLLPHPILLVSLNGHIRLANEAATILFGRNDVRGLHISALVRDPVFLDAFYKINKDGKTRRVNWNIHVPIERYFHVHITAALAPRRGMTPFILMTFDEQTDIRRAEQMRRDFIANASHELKTPLTILTGYLEILRGIDPQDQSTQQKSIKIMEEQSHTMAQLVDDLLSLSLIEQQEHRTPDKNISLAAMIREAANKNLPAAQQARVKIKTGNIPSKAYSKGDAKELVQAISNLIHNAITHGSSQSSSQSSTKDDETQNIDISLTEDILEGQPAWNIAVRDSGDGIASHHMPRLTERFYRVNPEESRKLGGTGLGLAIVKHILTRHRGVLRIHSREGQGSTFNIILPQNTQNTQNYEGGDQHKTS